MSKEPCDDFGRYLATIRKARRWSTRALSQALNLSESYIYKWEHEPRRVSREVLQRLAELLELAEPERRELFQLAAKRDAPEASKGLYDAGSDPDANLLAALLEIPHEWPSEPPTPNPRSERVQLLIDAIAWGLADSGPTLYEILPPFAAVLSANVRGPYKSIRWPEPLVRLGIVSLGGEPHEQLEIPEAMIQEELPFVHELREPVTPLDGATQGRGMARIYRRLLFSDLDRARLVVKGLAHWAFDWSQEASERLVLRWVPKPDCVTRSYGDLGCRIVAMLHERKLTWFLWRSGASSFDRWGQLECYCQWEPADWYALQSVGFLDRENISAYQNRQRLRDARYLLSYGTDYVLTSMREEFHVQLGSEPALQAQLEARRLTAATRRRIMAEPWRLAALEKPGLIPDYLWHLSEIADESEATPPEPAGHVPTRKTAKTEKTGGSARKPRSKKSSK